MPTSTLTKKVGPSDFGYIGAYLCDRYSSDGGTFKEYASLIELPLALTISSEGCWPFSLVGQVGEEKYSYNPRSDLLFSLRGYPLILVELCSDRTYESDRARLLLQAGVLVRVMNSIKPEGKESLIAVAIYVNAQWVAERYFVYQPDRSEQRVR